MGLTGLGQSTNEGVPSDWREKGRKLTPGSGLDPQCRGVCRNRTNHELNAFSVAGQKRGLVLVLPKDQWWRSTL